MKDVIKFIIFITTIFLVFFTKSYILFTIFILINFLLMICYRINIKSFVITFIYLLPFILFTFILNNLFVDLEYSILITIRLVITCHITYIFSNMMSTSKISQVITKLLYPLKILKVDVESIGIIIGIAICIIPIIQNEIYYTNLSLKSKGLKVNFFNIQILLKPILISIFKRTNEMEKCIISKGYIG